MSLVVIPPIVGVNLHNKIMMIGHYTASIITHYNALNMVAIFLDCTLGEPQIPSHSHPDI